MGGAWRATGSARSRPAEPAMIRPRETRIFTGLIPLTEALTVPNGEYFLLVTPRGRPLPVRAGDRPRTPHGNTEHIPPRVHQEGLGNIGGDAGIPICDEGSAGQFA